jgi:DNA-binding response OmpR family regulator
MAAKTIKVLIVEDDRTIRQMYEVKLALEGFQVEAADNGESGFKAVKEFNPDVVLLDIMMPEVTGVDFVGYLRKNQKYDKIKVIVMTNLDDPLMKKSFDGEVSGYIVKSDTTPAQVVEKIRSVLQ